MTKTALYAGSFDPPTFGHIDIIERAAKMFDKLIVAIGCNPDKRPLLPAECRVGLLRELCAGLPNVTVAAYQGLTVDFALKSQANILLRGIRNPVDLEGELQIACANRATGGLETLLLPTIPEFAAISSSLIKQIAAAGGNISSFAPETVCQAVSQAL